MAGASKGVKYSNVNSKLFECKYDKDTGRNVVGLFHPLKPRWQLQNDNITSHNSVEEASESDEADYKGVVRCTKPREDDREALDHHPPHAYCSRSRKPVE